MTLIPEVSFFSIRSQRHPSASRSSQSTRKVRAPPPSTPKGSEPRGPSAPRSGLRTGVFPYQKPASPADFRVSGPRADRLTCCSPEGGHQRPRKDRGAHTAASRSVCARAAKWAGLPPTPPGTRAVCAGVSESRVGRSFAVPGPLTRRFAVPPVICHSCAPNLYPAQPLAIAPSYFDGLKDKTESLHGSKF